MLKGKKVFVSGGAGVIGNSLVEKLLNAGARIFVGDLKPRPGNWPPDIRYRQGDLLHVTQSELWDFKPECFFHLAAAFERSTETYDFWEENDHHNVRLSHHLMTHLRDCPSLRKVVFASSYLVYDSELYSSDEPAERAVRLKESDRILPRNICGAAKLLHEMELRFLTSFSETNFEAVSARIFRSYGKTSRDVISRWIRMLLRGESIEVFKEEGLFDYISADEAAEGLLRLSAPGMKGVVNLGNGNARRVREVIELLRSHFPEMRKRDSGSDIPYEASQADMTRCRQLTGWVPERQIEDVIPELIDFEKSKKNRLLPLKNESAHSEKSPVSSKFSSETRLFPPKEESAHSEKSPVSSKFSNETRLFPPKEESAHSGKSRVSSKFSETRLFSLKKESAHLGKSRVSSKFSSETRLFPPKEESAHSEKSPVSSKFSNETRLFPPKEESAHSGKSRVSSKFSETRLFSLKEESAHSGKSRVSSKFSSECEPINLLVISVSRKVPLLRELRKALDKLSENGRIFGGDSDGRCIGRHFADEFWEMPLISDLKTDSLVDFCRKNRISAIIPTRDGELLYFAERRDELRKNGISVMISNPDGVRACVDKLAFYENLKAPDFRVIPTAAEISRIEADAYVAKERYGAGSRNIALDVSEEDARRHAQKLKEAIFQPYVRGREYSVDIYITEKGDPKGAVVRSRDLIGRGESQVTTTARNEALEQACFAIANALELRGHLLFQAIVDEKDEFHFVECNCRFGGASSLSVAAGLDTFYWFLLESQGADISEYPFLRTQKELRQIRYAGDMIICAHDK